MPNVGLRFLLSVIACKYHINAMQHSGIPYNIKQWIYILPSLFISPVTEAITFLWKISMQHKYWSIKLNQTPQSSENNRYSVCKFVIGGIGGADQTNGGPISVSSMSYHGHMKINCRADQLKLSSNRLGWSSHWLPWVFACGCSWQDSLYPHFLCSSFRITGACFRSPYSSREAVTDVTASLIGWG